MLDTAEIARALDEISILLALKGEGRFRVRAYERGARAVERTRADIGALIEQKRLTEIDQIGPALAQQIAELWGTGPRHCSRRCARRCLRARCVWLRFRASPCAGFARYMRA